MRIDEIKEPFTPGDTVTLNCTTTTGRVSLTGHNGKGKRQVRIYNSGSEIAFVNIGDDTVESTTAKFPVPPGAVEVITVQDAAGSQRYMAGITSTGTTTLFATVGEGL